MFEFLYFPENIVQNEIPEMFKQLTIWSTDTTKFTYSKKVLRQSKILKRILWQAWSWGHFDEFTRRLCLFVQYHCQAWNLCFGWARRFLLGKGHLWENWKLWLEHFKGGTKKMTRGNRFSSVHQVHSSLLCLHILLYFLFWKQNLSLLFPCQTNAWITSQKIHG